MLLGMLTCREALQRLDDYIDRELTPYEMGRVEHHLKICHECTRKFALETRFVSEMRLRLDHLQLSPTLMESISRSLSISQESAPEADPPAGG